MGKSPGRTLAGTAGPGQGSFPPGRTDVVPRIASLGPFNVPPPALSPVLQNFAALAVYLTVFIVSWTLPLVQHPGQPQMGQFTVDPNFYVWSMRWWPYALSHGLNPLHSQLIGAPHGFVLAWATTIPPIAVLFAPITTVFGPLASFNLLLVLAPPLSGWAAFLATRRLTERFWPALIAGAIYGFSTYEISHTAAGQPNLTVNIFMPILVYLVVVWFQGGLSRTAFVILTAVTLALQFLTFLETFAELTVVAVAALILGYVLASREYRPFIARLARQAGAGFLLALVLVSPYLWYALTNYPKALTRAPSLYALNIANLIVPRSNRDLGLSAVGSYSAHLSSVSSASDAAYIGIPLVLVVIALAISNWGSRLTRVLVVLLVLVVLAAVGPDLVVGSTQVGKLPWARLWALPLARSAEPYRFMLIGNLLLAIMVALLLSLPVWSSWLRAGRWLLGLLAVAAVVADQPPVVPAPPPIYAMPAFITTGEYHHYLRPGENVVVISGRGNAAMLFQADTNFYMRVAGGFINASLTHRSDQPPQVQALAHANPTIIAEFESFVHKAGIGAILVEADWQPKWTGVLDRIGARGTTVGGITIYRIGPCWPASCRKGG